MTISTTASRASYNGNGVTTAFAFPNLFFSNTDLTVILVNASNVSVTQVLNTDYTVTGAGLDAGGTVTMTVAPGVGERLVIVRQVPLVQETDYTAGDSFPAESHERALDYLTMQTQQLTEQLTRTLQLPVTSDADASSIDVGAVEIVAGIASDVSAVAAIDDDVALAAANIVAIQNAAGNAAAAAASAVAADASADAAAASAASIGLPLAVAQGGTGQITAAAAFNALKQNASESVTGVVELATLAEAQAGTDTTRAVTPAGLAAAKINRGTSVASTSGTAIDFTGIPAGVKRITVMFNGVSTTGSSPLLIQLGDSGGIETTGYVGVGASTEAANAATTSFTNAFGVCRTFNASLNANGFCVIANLDGNLWVENGMLGIDTPLCYFSAGRKTLSDVLTQVRITTSALDVFDAGSINIFWEF